MDRRGFLRGILAAGVAPAFVGSSVLMPVRTIITPTPEEVVAVAEFDKPAVYGEIARLAFKLLHENALVVRSFNRAMNPTGAQ